MFDYEIERQPEVFYQFSLSIYFSLFESDFQIEFASILKRFRCNYVQKNVASGYYIQNILPLEYQISYSGFSPRQLLVPSFSLHVLMTYLYKCWV